MAGLWEKCDGNGTLTEVILVFLLARTNSDSLKANGNQTDRHPQRNMETGNANGGQDDEKDGRDRMPICCSIYRV